MTRMYQPPIAPEWQDIAILSKAMDQALALQKDFKKQLHIHISTAAALCIDTFHHHLLHFEEIHQGKPQIYTIEARPLSAFATNVAAQNPSVQAEIRQIIAGVVQRIVKQLDLMGDNISNAFIKTLDEQTNPIAIRLSSLREKLSAFTVGVILGETLRGLPKSAVLSYNGAKGRLPPLPYSTILTQMKILVEGTGLPNTEYQAEVDFARDIGFPFEKVMGGTEFLRVLRKAMKAQVRYKGSHEAMRRNWRSLRTECDVKSVGRAFFLPDKFLVDGSAGGDKDGGESDEVAREA